MTSRRGLAGIERRGHALLIMLAVGVASTALYFTFASRLSVDIAQRRTQAGRLEALWLARSAVTAGVTGTRTVATGQGAATVTVARKGAEVRATADLAGAGRAEVRATLTGAVVTGWLEQFEQTK